jgi:hypothetical protein
MKTKVCLSSRLVALLNTTTITEPIRAWDKKRQAMSKQSTLKQNNNAISKMSEKHCLK